MAKKNKKSELDQFDGEDKKKSKFVSAAITALIVIIWLGIFMVLIKLDVGGFGSSVLSPILKDVPVINNILPETNDSGVSGDYPYKSLGEAIAYIKELELELQTYQDSDSDNSELITELQNEVARLSVFEDEQVAFEEIRSKFYEEVVFGDSAIDYENYKVFYEAIDPENAAILFKQVIDQLQKDEQYEDYAKTYSTMKPAQAAAIFAEMTGDMDTVVGILNAMSATDRGSIMGALSTLDPVFAAKVTKLLEP